MTAGDHQLAASATPLGGVPLPEREFQLFRELVLRHTGIALGPHKREMVRARLTRRLRALGLSSFAAYYQVLKNEGVEGEELHQFISAITTNVTSFFREAQHFRFLAERWLPNLRARAPRVGGRRLRLWCAGCSTGEEPYSLAMTLADALGGEEPGWDVRILASDIDAEVLRRAAEGIYPLERVTSLSRAQLMRHFLKGIGSHTGTVRVRPEVQSMVAFRRINLVESSWPIHIRFDAIFCRNVLIYFDRATQHRLIERFITYLKQDGLLFLGHSESLVGLHAGLQHVENTIYRPTGAPPAMTGPSSLKGE